ncbi:MAG: PAS domain S-box protein [Verrucomicrobiia bacterium]
MKTNPTDPSPRSGAAADLRRRAEERLSQGAEDRGRKTEDGGRSEGEAQRVLHELRVHQIELEMQNEELRRTQEELEASKARYFDLYEMAPVGYLVLSENGLIEETNLTAATLLDVVRAQLVRRLFALFIFKEDQDLYYLHRKKIIESDERQICELRMVKRDGTSFWVSIEGALSRADGGTPTIHMLISDITVRKRAEEQIAKQMDELRRWQAATLGREGRIGELKREVNALAIRLGQPPPYATTEGP